MKCNLCDGIGVYEIKELAPWTEPNLYLGYLCQDYVNLAKAAPDLLAELSRLIERCHELAKYFPSQAGVFHAMTQEARKVITRVI